MKLPLFVLAILMSAVVTACGEDTTEIYLGTLVLGTVAASDANDDGGRSQAYTINVREGVEHYIYLTSTNGNIAGIWSVDEDGYIVEADPHATTHTVTHTFSKTGVQELFLRSLDSQIPSSFTFKIWVP